MSNQFNTQLLVSGVQPGPEISPSTDNHFSRRKQFFLSLSVSLSPLFTSCGTLISIRELYDFLVEKLGGVEKTINVDGKEFQAILLNDRQRWGIGELWDVTSLDERDNGPSVCRYQCIDGKLKSILRSTDPTSTGAFVTKYIGRIEKEEIEKKLANKTRTLRINPLKGSQLAEAFIGSKLDNPNIVTPRAYFLGPDFEDTDGRICKAVQSMSPYEGVGDLSNFVNIPFFRDPKSPVQKDAHSSCNGKVPLREAILAPIVKDAIRALQYMHENQFVHGDFKLENVLVCRDLKQELGYTGKLIDFDMSCEEGSKTGLHGTYCHLAPERATSTRKNKPSDIWALGANLFWLFTKSAFRPYRSFPEFRDASLGGGLRFNSNDVRRMEENNLSESLKDLIRKLLAFIPVIRPNCDEILNASWFKECDEVIQDNKVYLQKTMMKIVQRSRPIFSPKIRRASKRLGSEELETSEEDPVVPVERAHLYSPYPRCISFCLLHLPVAVSLSIYSSPIENEIYSFIYFLEINKNILELLL